MGGGGVDTGINAGGMEVYNSLGYDPSQVQPQSSGLQTGLGIFGNALTAFGKGDKPPQQQQQPQTYVPPLDFPVPQFSLIPQQQPNPLLQLLMQLGQNQGQGQGQGQGW